MLALFDSLLDRQTMSTRLPKYAIVVMVLLLSALVPPRATLSQLATSISIAGIILLLRMPALGLIAILVMAMSIPYTIGTGTQTALHLAIVFIPVLVAIWLADMFRRRVIVLAPSSMNLALFALVASASLSLIAGNLPWNFFAGKASLQAQLGGWAIYVLAAAACLLVGNLAKDLRWLVWLTAIFLGIGAIYLVGRVINPLVFFTRYVIVNDATGSLFWVWMVALPAGQVLFNDELPRPLRIVLGGLALGTLAVARLEAFSWASGWLPPAVALATILFLRSPRLAILWALPAFVVFVLKLDSITSSVINEGDNLYSLQTRLAAWGIVLDAVKANPILGLGPSNYYFTVQLYPILGYYVNFNSHNNYVDLIAQTGLVGLGSFLWFAFATLQTGLWLRDKVGNGFARGYVYACIGGLAGTLAAGMLGDWFLPFVYNIGISGFRASLLAWMFLGGLIAINAMMNQQTSQSAENS